MNRTRNKTFTIFAFVAIGHVYLFGNRMLDGGSIRLPTTNTIPDDLRSFMEPEIVLNVALHWMFLTHVIVLSSLCRLSVGKPNKNNFPIVFRIIFSW